MNWNSTGQELVLLCQQKIETFKTAMKRKKIVVSLKQERKETTATASVYN